ncbi:exonuclease domain-containing protein [Emcibacter sp.]|uniref:exonuclease domain-containing protein n=1 Tax=Emcibacter sp. TaxID=1979954 RepID=UPI002AA5FE25|nr:exonuclease domain-containing protein [Emcibacter sp.]
MLRRWLYQFRRRRALRNSQDPELREFLEAPTVRENTPLKDIEFLALDFETTGLNVSQDQLLSFGLVVIRNLQVEMSTMEHFLIRPGMAVPGESAVIHQITDDEVAQEGLPPELALRKILRALKGRVLLAHKCDIERHFLNDACRKIFQLDLFCQSIDTLQIELRKLKRADKPIKSGDLRLWKLREDYGLPSYKAHHAAIDALACAELFLAQVSYMGEGATLGDLNPGY